MPDVTNGGYVDAVSSQHYLTRVESLRVRRWRINDNLPGVPALCPLIRRTEAVQEALQFDLGASLLQLNQAFGADILMRTASWLTFKESRASFLIERGRQSRQDPAVCPRDRQVLWAHRESVE